MLKASDIKLILPVVKEADITKGSTSSSLITLLLGDCLATTVMQQKNSQKINSKYIIQEETLVTHFISKRSNGYCKKMPVISYNKNFKDALKVMNQKLELLLLQKTDLLKV